LGYVIVDTSSILFGFANKRSVFEAVSGELGGRCLVSKGIITELTKISTRKGIRGGEAKAALWELSLKKIKIEANSKYPDSWIRERSQEKDIEAVVTNDTKLASTIQKERLVFKFSREGKLRKFNR
jgi:rRNA-processing protein FCF1